MDFEVLDNALIHRLKCKLIVEPLKQSYLRSGGSVWWKEFELYVLQLDIHWMGRTVIQKELNFATVAL